MLNKYIIHPESGVYFFGGGESPTQTPFYFCEKFVLLKCFVSLTSKPESTMFFLPKSNFAKSRLSQQHLKNISQNGNRPQIGMKIDNVWNHLVYAYTLIHQKQIFSVLKNNMRLIICNFDVWWTKMVRRVLLLAGVPRDAGHLQVQSRWWYFCGIKKWIASGAKWAPSRISPTVWHSRRGFSFS